MQPNHWSRYIRRIRRENRLDQAALGMTIGLNQGSISRWETGATIPTKKVQAILEALYGPPQPCDFAPIELIHAVAEQFISAQPGYSMLYDRGLVLRAKNTPSVKAKIGTSMEENAAPWEKVLVKPFSQLLDQIGFWDKPGTCWVYHNPFPGDAGDAPFLSLRLVLTCIDISGEIFMLAHPKPLIIDSGSISRRRVVTEKFKVEPFDPLPHELYLPLDLILRYFP